MKIFLTSLIGLLMIGITTFSYAQYTEVGPDTHLPEVMLQMELRDSNGNLISYIEAEQIIVIYPNELKFINKIQK